MNNKRQILNFLMVLFLMMGVPTKLLGVWNQPPKEFGPGFNIDIASDASGNAVVIFTAEGDMTPEVRAYYYSSSADTWSGPTLLQVGGASVDVDMDNSGTALAVWQDTTAIRSAFFDGSDWIFASPDPIELTTSGSPSVSMNGPNSGVAVWANAGEVRSSFFTAGVWSLPITIGTTNSDQTSVAYSTNGTAVAGFVNTNPMVANFVSGAWQLPVTLDLGSVPFGVVEVGIDATGKALAAWNNDAFNVVTRFFDGLTWQAIVTLDSGENAQVSLSMGLNGTGVATWTTYSAPVSVGKSSVFNGSGWIPMFPFFGAVYAGRTSVKVDDFGNAIVLFGISNQLLSAKLPLGGVWGNVQKIYEFGSNLQVGDYVPDLSNNGYAVAAWGVGIEGRNYFASVNPVPLSPNPPGAIEGSICKNNFASQTDRIHIIKFTPSTTPTVVSYNLRRNGDLIAVIPASGPYTYLDHNRCKKSADIYTLTAVDVNGLESTPVTVSLQ